MPFLFELNCHTLRHSGMRRPNSGLPECGNIIVQVATADLDAQARNPLFLRWSWIPGSRAEPVIGRRRAPTRRRTPE